MRNNRSYYQHLKKQRGAAAVWMGLLLVPIMGSVFWAVEGTRYVQETNRLRDAAEAAALAVTIADGGENAARAMAEKYIEYYVRDIQEQDVDITPKHQPWDRVNKVDEYIEYEVNAKTRHNSWFTSNFIPSFDQQEQLAGVSVARKFVKQEERDPVDIVFVADFSGSMERTLGTTGTEKIAALKQAIDQMSIKYLCVTPRYKNGEYSCDDKNETGVNQIGFVPFSTYTMESLNGKTETNSDDGTVELVNPRSTSQLVYSDKRADESKSVSKVGYNDIDWDIWTKISVTRVLNCANGGVCNIGAYSEADAAEYAKRIRDIRNSIKKRYRNITLDAPDYIDYKATVKDMFTNKSREKQNFFSEKSSVLINTRMEGFRNIELTNSLPQLNKIQKMPYDGYTASYQGILRGLQILNAGAPTKMASENERKTYQNKKKLLLIFTDGKESQPEILLNLANEGMCEKAREKFPNLLIAVIGIAHDVNNMQAYQKCVVDKKNDIIEVNNVDDLVNRIDTLILRGLRGYKETKLY